MQSLGFARESILGSAHFNDGRDRSKGGELMGKIKARAKVDTRRSPLQQQRNAQEAE